MRVLLLNNSRSHQYLLPRMNEHACRVCLLLLHLLHPLGKIMSGTSKILPVCLMAISTNFL